MGNEGLLTLGHKAKIPLTCGQKPHEEQGSPDRDLQGHSMSSASDFCNTHCLPPASACGFLSIRVLLPMSLSLAFLFDSLLPPICFSFSDFFSSHESVFPSLFPLLSFYLPPSPKSLTLSFLLSFYLFLSKVQALFL